MELRDRMDQGIAFVALSGRLTITDQPGLIKNAVVAAVEHGARAVCLDLSGVTYLDSTRLGELIAAHVTASRHGRRLKLVGTPQRILDLLSIAGLSTIFELFATEHDARASLES